MLGWMLVSSGLALVGDASIILILFFADSCNRVSPSTAAHASPRGSGGRRGSRAQPLPSAPGVFANVSLLVQIFSARDC